MKRYLEHRHKPGFVNQIFYRILLDSVHRVSGGMIEFGVFQGKTFKHIYHVARSQRKKAYAVDSFVGMPPGDTEEESRKFPKGAFNVGGPGDFHNLFPEARIYEGFVPDILKKIPPSLQFSFAHIDLDHEKPTYAALEWIWPRLTKHGILVCHDFHFGAKSCAPKAIEEWMATRDVVYVGIVDHSIAFRKGDS